MPRSARLDAPGVMHHIMIRGIERRKIFVDDQDREDFLSRLERLIPGDEDLLFCLGVYAQSRPLSLDQ